MKKIIKITLEDIEHIVKKTIKESEEDTFSPDDESEEDTFSPDNNNKGGFILGKGNDGKIYAIDPKTNKILGSKL